MILKGSQRAGGQNLAVHLMRTDDNEHVRIHEMRGFVADDLRGAFKEAEATARGTRCDQYLFSVSLSPPEDARVSVADFESAIDRVEERLGLEGQPRAVVFHEKEGRRHAHCVWSRIDAQTMTARPMSFFKTKLMGVSRDLYLDHGWDMPRGIAERGARDPANFTLADYQQAKRQGVDPRWTKAALQDCWKHSDNRAAFARSLEERGFFLAKGDRRGFVVVDHDGEVHSLPRALGLKTRAVRERLGDGDDLASVDQTRTAIGERMSSAMRRHVEESRTRFQKRSATLAHVKMEMTHRHRDARQALDKTLDAEWRRETRERAAQMPTGLVGLWHRITGKYQQQRAANEAEAAATRERQATARQNLIDRQLAERRVIQAEFKDLRHRQAEQLLELRKDVGCYLRFARPDAGSLVLERGREVGFGLRLSR